jgi:hypothetical protein
MSLLPLRGRGVCGMYVYVCMYVLKLENPITGTIMDSPNRDYGEMIIRFGGHEALPCGAVRRY